MTAYTALKVFEAKLLTISRTPGPSPFQGLAEGALPPLRATPIAIPISRTIGGGIVRRSRLERQPKSPTARPEPSWHAYRISYFWDNTSKASESASYPRCTAPNRAQITGVSGETEVFTAPTAREHQHRAWRDAPASQHHTIHHGVTRQVKAAKKSRASSRAAWETARENSQRKTLGDRLKNAENYDEVRSTSRSTTTSPSSPKSPRVLCVGFGTSTMRPYASSSSARCPSSISLQVSPLTTRNGPQPNSGSAWKIPPPSRSAPDLLTVGDRRTRGQLPSPNAERMRSPNQDKLITTSRTPAVASRSR